MSERVCKQCGKSLKYRRDDAIFCCKECGKLYRKEQRRAHISEKVCVVCGKSFKPHSPLYVCCSEECSIEYKKARKNEYNKERNQKIKKQNQAKICVVCGTPFVPKYTHSICCSYTCSKKRNIEKGKSRKQANQSVLVAEKQGFLKQCIICGKEFFSHQPSSVMCSDECRRIRKQQQYAMDMMQAFQQEALEAGAAMPSWDCATSHVMAKSVGFG